MFAAGALIRVDVFLLGRLAVGELLLIAYVPFALSNVTQMCSVPYFKKLWGCLFLWLIGVILSDVVNFSQFGLFLRGAARPLICMLVLVSGYSLIVRDRRSIVYFFFGLFLSGLLNYFMPSDFRVNTEVLTGSIDDLGYGTLAFLLTPLVYGVASVGGYLLYRITPLFCGVFQIIVGCSSAVLLSRTTAAVIVVSGLTILMYWLLPMTRSFFFDRGRLKDSSIYKLIFALIFGFCVVYYIYAFFAGSGMMGERQYLKFVGQTSTAFGNTPWGVLASGRHYTVAAILRIIENPLFGAGSWPYAGDTLARTFELLGIYNYRPDLADPFQREIGHSIIFGIWAQNGPLVLPAFIMVLYATMRLFLHLAFGRDPLKALILLYLITFLFTMFFNNFNSLARVQMMFFPLMYFFYVKEGMLGGSHALLGGSMLGPPSSRESYRNGG
jgi:hypothetical protein